MMSFYDPMEIIVTPDVTYILISHNDDLYRRIYTDGRDWPTDPSARSRATRSASGSTRTATASTTRSRSRPASCKGPRAYDTSGIPFHEDNQTIIKERIYLDKADRNTLYDEITVIDHALTRPYVKLQKAIRKPNPRPVWQSEVCSEDNTWVKIGNEPYYLSADGKLMPA